MRKIIGNTVGTTLNPEKVAEIASLKSNNGSFWWIATIPHQDRISNTVYRSQIKPIEGREIAVGDLLLYTDGVVQRIKSLGTSAVSTEETGVKIGDGNGVEADLDNYYTKEQVDNKIENAELDFAGYATEEYVDDTIANIEVNVVINGSDGEGETEVVSTTYTLTAESPNRGFVNKDKGTVVEREDYRYTDYIEIFPGSDIIISYASSHAGAFYDINKNFVSGIYNGSESGFVENYRAVVPTECYYVRLNAPISKVDEVTFEILSYVAEHVVDSLQTKLSPNGKKEVLLNNFLRKRLLTFGDSITWLNDNGKVGYQTNLKNNLHLVAYLNKGVSGASISTVSKSLNYTPIVETVLNFTDFSKYDLITVFGGTNDFKMGASLGEIGAIGDTDFDTTTFYGGYRTIIEHILTNKPTTRLVLVTPLQRNKDNYNSWNTTNSQGHSLKDFVEAVKKLGEMYSLPVVDLFAESGINNLTLSTFTYDGLHPNNEGFVRVANCIMGELIRVGL